MTAPNPFSNARKPTHPHYIAATFFMFLRAFFNKQKPPSADERKLARKIEQQNKAIKKPHGKFHYTLLGFLYTHPQIK